MRKILPIHTGGTISSASSSLGAKPSLTFSNLMDELKKRGLTDSKMLDDIMIDREIVPFGRNGLNSSNMQIQHINKLSASIAKNYHKYDAFLITHGTDTMAFTSAFLGVAFRGSTKPIVITGSQRLPEEPETDAFRNLEDALYASKHLHHGVWIVFNGKVINGKTATKVDTERLDAFQSVSQNEWKIKDIPGLTMPRQSKISKEFFHDFSDDIDILYLSNSITPRTLHAYLKDAKPSGLVVLVFGLGGQRAELWDVLGDWISKGNIVIAKSQCLFGKTDITKYATGRYALLQGIWSAGTMTLETAYARLSYMVANSIFDEKVFNRELE